MPPVVSSSTTINKSPDAVFNFLADIANQKRLAPTILEAHVTPPGPVALNSQFHYTTDVMGRKYESAVQVSAFDPGKKFALKTINVPRSTETVYTLEPAGAGTKMTVSMELSGGYPAAAEATVKATTQKSLDDTCAKYKQMIEA